MLHDEHPLVIYLQFDLKTAIGRLRQSSNVSKTHITPEGRRRIQKKINACSSGKHGVNMLSTNTMIMINEAVSFSIISKLGIFLF